MPEIETDEPARQVYDAESTARLAAGRGETQTAPFVRQVRLSVGWTASGRQSVGGGRVAVLIAPMDEADLTDLGFGDNFGASWAVESNVRICRDLNSLQIMLPIAGIVEKYWFFALFRKG
jgi:hypothetical protein